MACSTARSKNLRERWLLRSSYLYLVWRGSPTSTVRRPLSVSANSSTWYCVAVKQFVTVCWLRRLCRWKWVAVICSDLQWGALSCHGMQYVSSTSTVQRTTSVYGMTAGYSKLQWVVVSCSELQWVAMQFSALQWVAVCCNASQSVVVHCSALQWVAISFSVSQFVAVCCSMLQYVTVSCIAVLQRLSQIHGTTPLGCVRQRLWLTTTVVLHRKELQPVAASCSELQWVATTIVVGERMHICVMTQFGGDQMILCMC